MHPASKLLGVGGGCRVSVLPKPGHWGKPQEEEEEGSRAKPIVVGKESVPQAPPGSLSILLLLKLLIRIGYKDDLCGTPSQAGRAPSGQGRTKIQLKYKNKGRGIDLHPGPGSGQDKAGWGGGRTSGDPEWDEWLRFTPTGSQDVAYPMPWGGLGKGQDWTPPCTHTEPRC